MRVVLTGSFPGDGQPLNGGVEAATAYLAEALAKAPGIEVHVITRHEQVDRPASTWRRGPIQVHCAPAARYELARRFRSYREWFSRKLTEIQPDLVHAQDATGHAYAALQSGYPSVITVHGIRREDCKYYGRLRVRVRNYLQSLLIERYVVRNSKFLIAISRYVTDYFSGSLRPDVEVHYICNAIDRRFFQPGGNRPAFPAILYAGRVIPRKRVDDLIRSFGKVAAVIPAVRLKIAGDLQREPSYVASIRQLTGQLQLENRVDFLGRLNEDDVLKEFQKCAALALPSAQETAPMVIAQAQAAAKPVVATPVGGVEEMIEEGRTGFLVPVGAIDSMANRLLQLLINPVLGEEIGAAARCFAQQNYSADSVARRTLEVYRRVKQTPERSRAA